MGAEPVATDLTELFPELTEVARWVAWRRERRGGDETKVPVDPSTGRYASSTDPATWGTLAEARARSERDGLAGVGIVLGDGLGGIDLDACRDPETGELAPWARKVIRGFRSYAEVSPSGSGVKVLAWGAPDELPASTIPMDGPSNNGKAPAVECYVGGRYFTVTGQVLPDVPAEIVDAGDPGGPWSRMVGWLRERAGRSGPDGRDGGSDVERWIRALENGGPVHDSATRLVGRWVAKGLTDAEIRAMMARIADRVAQKRGAERAKTLMGSELDRMIQGARRKAYDLDRGTGEVLGGEEAGPPPTLTDSGNSTRLARLHGARLHYIAPWGKWLACEKSGFWTLDHGEVRVRELAKDVGLALKREAAEEPDEDRAKKLFSWGLSSLNSGRITSMVNLARGIGSIPLDHEDLDADGWLLGVENGVVELRTGRHREADPDDLMTLQCPVPWEEGARAPRWERALQEWFPDPEVRAYVHRVAGAALVGGQRDHVFIIHYGIGGNGKGTFTRALQRVLGPYSVEVHLTLLVQTKHSEHDTVKADLFRTRLAVAVETDRRVELAEASVKNLTGGDPIRARRMREDPWSFDPTHSLWLQTNHLPEISGRDEGIWRRIRVVKWENTFQGQDADPDLDDTLAAESPGILRWLVEGCLEWQAHGLDEPESVVRDTLAYRQKEDVLSRFASDTGLVFRADLQIQAREVQDLLEEWAHAEGVDPPRQDVNDWLREHDCRQKRPRVTDPDGKTRRRRVWTGVGIDDGEHQTEQTHAL